MKREWENPTIPPLGRSSAAGGGYTGAPLEHLPPKGISAEPSFLAPFGEVRHVHEQVSSALRLLARAVRACGPGVATDALQALGRFPHPLALEVLREVVERNNRDDLDLEEVEAALHSIHSLGIKEAHTFLWEIVQSRRSLFSYAYVRPVRVVAESVLQGGARR